MPESNIKMVMNILDTIKGLFKKHSVDEAQHVPELQRMNGGRGKMYIEYLKSAEAEMDLRKYCYFLEHNCCPPNEQVNLPDL